MNFDMVRYLKTKDCMDIQLSETWCRGGLVVSELFEPLSLEGTKNTRRKIVAP